VLLVSGDSSHEKVDEVDARVRFLLGHIGKVLDHRVSRSPRALDYVRETAVIAVDANAVPKFARRHIRWVADLDYERNPTDGWALMDLGVALRSDGSDIADTARKTFGNHVETLKRHGPRPVYLFGTGPSLGLAGNRSFADGVSVVCNTIVRDAELFHHLSPAILVAGDAIYHFGHTPHAVAFRQDALRRLIESDGHTIFVYPSQFDVIVRSEFAEVRELLVPIPYGTHTDITVDLTRDFRLPILENVLANLLLPVGCTLSPDVRMWGFDGRAPTDSGFWANSSRHAYPDLMQTIREAHPAFFANKTPKGNEAKYANKVHGDLLDERLTAAEIRGFQFTMLHSSWSPTLQRRYRVDDNLDLG
jgi:hypothetical protein